MSGAALLTRCYHLVRGAWTVRRWETDPEGLLAAFEEEGFREGYWLTTRTWVGRVGPVLMLALLAWTWVMLFAQGPVPVPVALLLAMFEALPILASLIVLGADLGAPDVARREKGLEVSVRGKAPVLVPYSAIRGWARRKGIGPTVLYIRLAEMPFPVLVVSHASWQLHRLAPPR